MRHEKPAPPKIVAQPKTLVSRVCKTRIDLPVKSLLKLRYRFHYFIGNVKICIDILDILMIFEVF